MRKERKAFGAGDLWLTRLSEASSLIAPIVHACHRVIMANPLKRYRAYLREKVRSTDPPRTVDAGAQAVPWFVPFLPLIIVQVVWEPESEAWYYLVGVTGAIALAGALYVHWVFLVEGFRTDLRDYKETKKVKPPK